MVCGDTEVAATDLRITLDQLKAEAEGGRIGFERQFQVELQCVWPFFAVCKV